MIVWIKKFISCSYDIASTKWGSIILFLLAFADASFLPLPVTSIFMILVLSNKHKVVRMIFSVVGGTLSGAVAGYLFGHFFCLNTNNEFTGMMQFFMQNIPGFSMEIYDKVYYLFSKWNIGILTAATVTPLPYGIFSIASGAFGINIFVFILTTFTCQAIKFIFLALFSVKLTPKVKNIAEPLYSILKSK